MKKSENDRNNGSMCKQSNVTHPGLISGTRPRYHVSTQFGNYCPEIKFWHFSLQKLFRK